MSRRSVHIGGVGARKVTQINWVPACHLTFTCWREAQGLAKRDQRGGNAAVHYIVIQQANSCESVFHCCSSERFQYLYHPRWCQLHKAVTDYHGR